MLINILIIVAMYKLLLATDKPFLCSGFHAGILLLAAGIPAAMNNNDYSFVLPLAIHVAIIFAVASLFYWLLNRFEDGARHWVIFGVGAVILAAV